MSVKGFVVQAPAIENFVVFAWRVMACQEKIQRYQFMRWHKLMTSSLVNPNLFWRLSTKMLHLVAGCVMEGVTIFCQKKILEHSMKFHGDYLKRCLLTHRVSQIL